MNRILTENKEFNFWQKFLWATPEATHEEDKLICQTPDTPFSLKKKIKTETLIGERKGRKLVAACVQRGR